MAKPNADRDSGHWSEGVCGIVAMLLFLLRYAARNPQMGQPFFPRERGVADYQLEGNNETWEDLDIALAMPSSSGDLRFFPNIDPEGQCNVPLVDQPPAVEEPVQNIDADNADNAAAAEADLEMLLALAEIVGLPRQIERDEANMMVILPPEPLSVAESGTTPWSLVDDVAVGASEHPPPPSPIPEAVAADAPALELVGSLAGVLPQQIEHEHEHEAHIEARMEVAIEDFPPRMLELILDDTRPPQVAAASMIVPAGGLESNLEELWPATPPEAGDSSLDLQAEENTKDEEESLEVEDLEPHAEGMR